MIESMSERERKREGESIAFKRKQGALLIVVHEEQWAKCVYRRFKKGKKSQNQSIEL